MGDASQQEIVQAWSNADGVPADRRILENINKSQASENKDQSLAQSVTEVNRMQDVAVDAKVAENAHDSAIAFGEKINETNTKAADAGKLAEIRRKLSEMFRPRQKTPQTA